MGGGGACSCEEHGRKKGKGHHSSSRQAPFAEFSNSSPGRCRVRKTPYSLPRAPTDTQRPSRAPGPPFPVKDPVEGAGAGWTSQPRGPGQVRENPTGSPSEVGVHRWATARAMRARARGSPGRGPGPPASSLRRQRRARRAAGTRAEGRGAGPRPPLPSLQSFSQLHIHSALPVGVGAAPSRPGRPPAPGGRKRGDASRTGAAAGPQRAERGRPGAPRGPGVPGSRGRPGRREGALPPRARRGRDGGARAPAGKGRAGPPGVSPGADAGRGRLHPGSPRLSSARPGRPLLTQGAGEQREQCRQRQAAAAAGGRQHPGGGAALPIRARGLETRGERSCTAAAAAAPAAAADPSPRLPSSLPRPRADSGRALWRPVAGTPSCALPAPAWLVAVAWRSPGAGPASLRRLTSVPCGLHVPFSFLSFNLGLILCLRALLPCSITSLSSIASSRSVSLLIPKVKLKRGWAGEEGESFFFPANVPPVIKKKKEINNSTQYCWHQHFYFDEGVFNQLN